MPSLRYAARRDADAAALRVRQRCLPAPLLDVAALPLLPDDAAAEMR